MSEALRDLDELKRAETVLREREERFRYIIKYNPNAIAVLDREMRYLMVSDRFLKDYRVGEQDVIGKCHYDIFPEIPDRWRQIHQRCLAGGVERSELDSFVRPDGSVDYNRWECRPWYDAQGRVGGVILYTEILNERMKAEAELQRFRAALDSAVDNILIIDPIAMRFIDVSQSACEDLGYSREELLKLGPQDIKPRFSREEIQRRFEEIRSDPAGKGSISTVHRRKDGSEFEVEVRVRPVEIQGRPMMVAVARDMTEHKQAEETLRRHQALLQRVLEVLPVGVWLIDKTGRIVGGNHAGEQIWGGARLVPTEQFGEYKGWWHETGQLIAPTEWAAARAVQKGETSLNELIDIETFDGQRKTIINAAMPIRDERERIIGAVSVNQDITVLKQTEAALLRRNKSLALLSEAAAHLLMVENPDTMVRELFDKVAPHLDLQAYMNFMVNESGEALRLASYAGIAEEAVPQVTTLAFGQGVCGTVAQRRSPICATFIQQSSAEMVQTVKQLGFRAYACQPLLAGDRLLGTLAFASRTKDQFDEDELEFMRTICQYVAMAKERLRLEEERRRHLEQLAEADRQKDEFLAMLAHELRNPLAPIRNAVQVLRLLDQPAPSHQRQHDIIDRQIAHMARLLSDLLDVSRITRGKITLNRQPLALVRAVEHALETTQPLFDARHQELSITPPPPDVYVQADLDRLAQAIGNLLANAAKYTDEGGRIWLDCGLDRGQAFIRVRDTGVGIAPEMQPRIFDLFAQVDHSLARSQGGLGIGLTMARRLVEMHGGRIEVHSPGLGLGSEFTIHLPLLAAGRGGESPAPPQLANHSEAPHPQRILVVDDIQDTARSLSDLLALWGHQVRIAYDGPSALEAARQFSPEVVLLDIGLPGMSGYEVARHLRQEPDLAEARIIALTGYGQEADRQRARAAGFSAHLVKPVDLADLKQLLAQAA